MVEYTQNQLRIAASLIKSSKTMEELRVELNISLGVMEKELATLIKLKTVKKEGYPTKYSIVDQVRRGVMGDNDATEKTFKAHAIIEGQSKSREELIKATNHLLDKLKADKLVAVTNIEEDEPMEGGGFFTINFGVDIATNSFEDMAYFVLTYGPTSIELSEPKEFDIKVDEAQGILMDIATSIHAYVSLIAQLKVTMQDSDSVYIRDPKKSI